jgi:hypothetical protein
LNLADISPPMEQDTQQQSEPDPSDAQFCFTDSLSSLPSIIRMVNVLMQYKNDFQSILPLDWNIQFLKHALLSRADYHATQRSLVEKGVFKMDCFTRTILGVGSSYDSRTNETSVFARLLRRDGTGLQYESYPFLTLLTFIGNGIPEDRTTLGNLVFSLYLIAQHNASKR